MREEMCSLQQLSTHFHMQDTPYHALNHPETAKGTLAGVLKHCRQKSNKSPSIKSSLHTLSDITSTCFCIFHITDCNLCCPPFSGIACVLKVICFQPVTCYFISAFGSSWYFFILLMFSKTDLICCAILQALPRPSSQGI